MGTAVSVIVAIAWWCGTFLALRVDVAATSIISPQKNESVFMMFKF
jgi:hypothetical protein